MPDPRRWTSLAGAVLCAVLALAFAAAAGAQPTSTAGQECGTVQAGGHSYTVAKQNNVKCSFALKWAATLVKKAVPAHTSNFSLGGSPRGYKCVGNSKFLASSFPGVGATTQVSGFCRKGSALSGPYFNWFVKTG